MALTGTLKSFMEGKGFGFIKRDDGEEDVFMHYSKLTNGGAEDMAVGMRVAFDLQPDEKSGKMRAANITITAPGSGPVGGAGSEPSEVGVSGVLKSFAEGKGFGFIQRDDGKEDVFMHFSKLRSGGVQDMAVGMRVCFDVEMDDRSGKARAANVAITAAAGDGEIPLGGNSRSMTREFGSGLASPSRPSVASEATSVVHDRVVEESDSERRAIPESDGGGTYAYSELRVAFPEYSDADLQGYWRDVCKSIRVERVVQEQAESPQQRSAPSYQAPESNHASRAMPDAGQRPAVVAGSFKEWLMGIDASGSLLVYLEALEENFDTVAQVVKSYTIRSGASQMLDQQFFQDVGVTDSDHCRQFESWFRGDRTQDAHHTEPRQVQQINDHARLEEQRSAGQAELSRQTQVDSRHQVQAEVDTARTPSSIFHPDVVHSADSSQQLPAQTSTQSLCGGAVSCQSSFSSSPLAEQFPMFVLLQTMDQAMYLSNSKLGIARRAGVQLSIEQGPAGEAILRIFGHPAAAAVACYLVQEASRFTDWPRAA